MATTTFQKFGREWDTSKYLLSPKNHVIARGGPAYSRYLAAGYVERFSDADGVTKLAWDRVAPKPVVKAKATRRCEACGSLCPAEIPEGHVLNTLSGRYVKRGGAAHARFMLKKSEDAEGATEWRGSDDGKSS